MSESEKAKRNLEMFVYFEFLLENFERALQTGPVCRLCAGLTRSLSLGLT